MFHVCAISLALRLPALIKSLVGLHGRPGQALVRATQLGQPIERHLPPRLELFAGGVAEYSAAQMRRCRIGLGQVERTEQQATLAHTPLEEGRLFADLLVRADDLQQRVNASGIGSNCTA